ncbi:MAG: hypothetical protein ACTSVV_07215 [Promethearchaeota archaeon]
MVLEAKKIENFYLFKSLKSKSIKYQIPLILKMFGLLNKMNYQLENRYILCNFLDQNSDIINLNEDIYDMNCKYSLNQLLLLTLRKAKEFNLIDLLYEEYLNCFNAIGEKEIKIMKK